MLYQLSLLNAVTGVVVIMLIINTVFLHSLDPGLNGFVDVFAFLYWTPQHRKPVIHYYPRL